VFAQSVYITTPAVPSSYDSRVDLQKRLYPGIFWVIIVGMAIGVDGTEDICVRKQAYDNTWAREALQMHRGLLMARIMHFLWRYEIKNLHEVIPNKMM
jgi:hypothetical protein